MAATDQLDIWSGFSLPFPGACLTVRMTSESSRCTWTRKRTASMWLFRAASSAFPWAAARGIPPAISKSRSSEVCFVLPVIGLWFYGFMVYASVTLTPFPLAWLLMFKSSWMIVPRYQILLTVFPRGDQVVHRIEGSVLRLEGSRSVWEDTARRPVSLTAISNMKPGNSKMGSREFSNLWLIIISLFLPCRTEYEQDVESGNTTHLGDCHGMTLISMLGHWFRDTQTHTHLCTPWARTLTPVTAPVTPPPTWIYVQY